MTFDDVLAAKQRISHYIWETPLELSIPYSNENTSVYLKLESQQRLKSFKIRGALSKLTNLSEEEKKRGVMTISSGNHGAGISYGASLLKNMNATVFVPATTPEAKVEKIKYYGADVKLEGDNYDDTYRIALEYLNKHNLTFVDSCSDVEVIAGQGTIAIEILEENPNIDTILVPIGGGGMITGIAVAAKAINPTIKIIGIQTAACPAMVKSMEDKKCYLEFPNEPSLCEALVGGVGEIPYHMADTCIDDIILVEEDLIKKAVAQLLKKEKVIAEVSGAIGYAAIMANPNLIKGRNVAVIISGGNLDEKLVQEIFLAEIVEENI